MEKYLGTKQPQYLLSDFLLSAGFSSHMQAGIGNHIGDLPSIPDSSTCTFRSTYNKLKDCDPVTQKISFLIFA
jgi:hypothetical protein